VAFRLTGTKSNRDAIGARIRVKAGARTLIDEVRSGSSFDSNNDMRVHFGLGTAARIEWVEVRWPTDCSKSLTTLKWTAFAPSKREAGSTATSEIEEASLSPPPSAFPLRTVALSLPATAAA